MEILTIKQQENGYLVNDTTSVPKAEGNKDYAEVLDAIAGGSEKYPTAIVVEPEFTNLELETIGIYEDALARRILLDELVITHNTVAYDANGKSIGNMSAVMGVAHFKFVQATSIGLKLTETSFAPVLSNADAYQLIYKDTTIFWKGADDKPHEVMIESVVEALEKTMNSVSDILGL